MSIIIRLQNLPWTANSMDIRRYFGGLIIPDGGVHIVGGEKGDAFIAFATDEDARQAMERDNGKIKDVRIKLLLSSRNEMQRIIDVARNQTLVAQGMGVGAAATVVLGGKPSKSSNSPDRRRSRSPDRRRDRDRDRDKGSKKSKRKSRSRSRSPSRRNRRRERSKESHRRLDEMGAKKDESSRSSLDNNHGEFDKSALPPLPDAPLVPVPLPPAPTPDLALLAPRLPNMSFPPLFPIVNPGTPLNLGMNMPPMAMPVTLPEQFNARMGFDGLPSQQTDSRDSFDKRDPPVWQNPPNSIPFNLPIMRMNAPGPGKMGIEPPLLGNNSNLPNRMERAPLLPNIPLPPSRDDSSNSNPQAPPNRQPMNETNIYSHRRNGSPTSQMSSRNNDNGRRGGDSRYRGYAVELRNMPYTITYREVREYLKGCQMPPDGLTLVEVNGRRTGVGYVLLSSERDVQEALRKSKGYMLNRRVEIRRCDEDDFIDAWENAGNRVRKLPKNTEDLVIVLKGIPFSSTEKDIVQFLNGLQVSDVVVQYDQMGKTVGTGYARFSSYDDYKIALTFDGKPLQHRFVEIVPSTIEKMYEASKYSPAPMGRPQFPKTTPLNDDVINNIRSSNKSFAVALRGLPPNVVDNDIVAFFSRAKVEPQAVHIMVNPNGLPSGDAFAEFSNGIDLEKALKQDGEIIGGRVVRINPIAIDKMHQILGRPSFPARNANESRGPLIGAPPRIMDPEFDVKMDNMANRPPFMGDADMELEPDIDMNGPSLFGGPPNFGRPRGPVPMGPMTGGGVVVPVPGGPMGGVPPFPMMGQPRFRPMIRPQVPDNFGKPGCVVAARNISFRATDADLLELFKAYNIKHSNIIRRFDNMGNITGDARVDFNTPEDAARAIVEFSGQMFLGRNIILSKPS